MLRLFIKLSERRICCQICSSRKGQYNRISSRHFGSSLKFVLVNNPVKLNFGKCKVKRQSYMNRFGLALELHKNNSYLRDFRISLRFQTKIQRYQLIFTFIKRKLNWDKNWRWTIIIFIYCIISQINYWDFQKNIFKHFEWLWFLRI